MPQKIAKYKVEGVLGSGAMGVVYKAHDEQIDRPVAIKVLHEHLRVGADGETLAARFLQEARAAARCLHPNIVTVFDFGNEDVPYIVMEYVEGTELRTLLKSSTKISLAEAVNITIQVLEALAFAHAKGVVHRDIKPDNIILLQDGTIKVSDFGVARLDTSDLTGTGFMIGTPSYMSPEGLKGKHVDGRSDLFSVGVVLFELLTRQRFDRESSIRQNLEKIKSAQTISKTNLGRMQRILARVLQDSPADRFQNASEFIQELIAMDDVDALATVMLARPAQDQQATRIMETKPADDGLDGELLQQLEQSLATYVGPVAKLLLKKCLRSTETFEALIEQLSTHIPTEIERGQFKGAVRRSGITSLYPSVAGNKSSSNSGVTKLAKEASPKPQQDVTPAKQAALAELLAFYTGPIAQRLVHKYLPESSSIMQLANACARHILDANERQQFLDKAARL
jgi:Serine/threonine protein kinase